MHACTCDDDFVVLKDLHLVFVEDGNAVVVAELSKGDECAGA